MNQTDKEFLVSYWKLSVLLFGFWILVPVWRTIISASTSEACNQPQSQFQPVKGLLSIQCNELNRED